jgi:hypothetical protein
MPPYYYMQSIKKMKKKRTLFLTPWIKQSGNLGEKDFSFLPRLLGKTGNTNVFPQNCFPLLK